MDRLPLGRTASVIVRLLPVILRLRRDRRRWANSRRDTESYRRNARRALDTFVYLGPVYIKLGQWLSSRADILPQPYMEELAKLQDEVPAAPFEKTRGVIESSVGSISGTFDTFDTVPISGASLGQVYRAAIDGKEVAVKVRRPGIDTVVERDIAVLKRVLPAALSFVDPNLRFSARAMLAQFIESIHEEMDYERELSHLRTIRHNMAGDDTVIIPQAYEEYCSDTVLVMEYLPGIKVTDMEELDRVGVDRGGLVVSIHRIFFTMLLRHSVFHADPHPGNISVTDDGRLILYDFGMVGRLDKQTRLRLIRLYLALVEKSPPRTVRAMDELGMLAPGYDRTVMEKAVRLTVEAMHGRKPDEMEVRGLMELANRTMSRFPFLLPKNLALYMRMASIIEGIYKTHKVDFRFVPILRDILERENLARDGYLEELKVTAGRILQSLDEAISIVPEMRRMLNDERCHRGGRTLTAGAVFSGLVFTGSCIAYSAGRNEGLLGVILSLVLMGVFYRLRNR